MKDSSIYRELIYKVASDEEGITVREVMATKLSMSGREITRCKQFEDGVCVLRSDSARETKSASDAETEDTGITLNTVNAGNARSTGNTVTAGVSGKDIYKPVLVKENLRAGDVLRVRIYEANESAEEVLPWDHPIDIIYEDEDLIVLNKPGDMVAHPSYAHYTDSLSNALMGYYKRSGQIHVIRPIGRLDRETAGLILFAKNRYSASRLSDQSGNMSRHKEYLAIVNGILDEKAGTIDAPIERDPSSRMIRRVDPEGKRAVTHYEVMREFQDYSLVKLRLDTGRTHQIRVHMAYLGHPLLGDGLYGKEIFDNHGMERAALLASHLEFFHPVTGEKCTFDAPLPDDMKRLLNTD